MLKGLLVCGFNVQTGWFLSNRMVFIKRDKHDGLTTIKRYTNLTKYFMTIKQLAVWIGGTVKPDQHQIVIQVRRKRIATPRNQISRSARFNVEI